MKAIEELMTAKRMVEVYPEKYESLSDAFRVMENGANQVPADL